MLKTTTAEHEAAHVVIGVALGLKLQLACATPAVIQNALTEGHVSFRGIKGWGRRRVAFGVMYCAGIAYEKRPGGDLDYSDTDFQLARQCFTSTADVQTGIRIALEMMRARKRALARVASELLERNLGPRDIERLAVEL